MRREPHRKLGKFELYGSIYQIFLDFNGVHIFVLWEDDNDDEDSYDEDVLSSLHLWLYDEDETMPSTDMIMSDEDGYVCKIVGVDDV
jgi:hypothetical protein